MIDIEELKELLAPWAKVATWDTSHPLDQARFNQAVAAAIRHFGTELDVSHFRKAINDIASQHHQRDITNPDLANKINKMSQKAEDYSIFLKDNDIRL